MKPSQRSARQCEPIDRLSYSHLGHPLISVIQSLFQGLNTAFVSSLGGLENGGIQPHEIGSSVVTIQPLRGCTGTCTPLGGEGVAQVISY